MISVANPVNNGFRYVSNSSAGEYATGSTFIIPANFPKGYGPFYIMKYELTEGQWVEFANSLPSQAARANRDLTDNNHKNSDGIQNRNTMACSGSPLVCSTTRPARPVSFLSWMDLVAFLDWNSLRPMTELEFEKVSRGPSLPNAGEYVWGTTNITAATTISGNEDGTEIITNQNANANFCNTTFSDGDAVSGVENQTGALRTGIFAATNSNRETAGASYYGVMDLGGNLKERVVTIGNAQGLLFTGVHGDGNLTNTSGHEGNSDIATWPGIDASLANGITGATGSGFHGGSWFDVQDRLRISDRQEASLTSASASNTFGGRGVRTYDGN